MSLTRRRFQYQFKLAALRRLETGVAIAGHVLRPMRAHYSYFRLQAKWKALETVSGRYSEGAHLTKSETAEVPLTPVIGSIGRADGS